MLVAARSLDLSVDLLRVGGSMHCKLGLEPAESVGVGRSCKAVCNAVFVVGVERIDVVNRVAFGDDQSLTVDNESVEHFGRCDDLWVEEGAVCSRGNHRKAVEKSRATSIVECKLVRRRKVAGGKRLHNDVVRRHTRGFRRCSKNVEGGGLDAKGPNLLLQGYLASEPLDGIDESPVDAVSGRGERSRQTRVLGEEAAHIIYDDNVGSWIDTHGGVTGDCIGRNIVRKHSVDQIPVDEWRVDILQLWTCLVGGSVDGNGDPGGEERTLGARNEVSKAANQSVLLVVAMNKCDITGKIVHVVEVSCRRALAGVFKGEASTKALVLRESLHVIDSPLARSQLCLGAVERMPVETVQNLKRGVNGAGGDDEILAGFNLVTASGIAREVLVDNVHPLGDEACSGVLFHLEVQNGRGRKGAWLEDSRSVASSQVEAKSQVFRKDRIDLSLQRVLTGSGAGCCGWSHGSKARGRTHNLEGDRVNAS